MGYKVIITEKPSVANDIAKVIGAKEKKDGYIEGNGYKVTWCIGHLISLAQPEEYKEEYKEWKKEDLPIIPEQFKTCVLPKTKRQYEIIKKLLLDKETETLICATDAGREGELIFRLIYNQIGCKKPVKRLWISSMTDEAIKKGFNEMKELKHYDNLYMSAKARQEADWIIGINSTRLYTVLNRTKLTIGRVQTPTLAMIVNRHNEIINFVPRDYYEIIGDFGIFKAKWQDDKGNTKIDDPALADAIKFKCAKTDGRVIKVITKEIKEERPLLYDLTELQKDANKRYGMTAIEVLEIAQELYEKHKIITYPRTDSRYLPEDIIYSIKNIVKIMGERNCLDLSKYAEKILKEGPNIDKRVIDNTKISDHHAIVPTDAIRDFDFSKLNESETKIFLLIAARLLITLSKPHIYESTEIIATVDTIDGTEFFGTKGKRVIKNAWKEIEESIFSKDPDNTEKEEESLQDIKPLQRLHLGNTEVIKKKTEPKKYYNDSTLLSAMVNASDSIEDEELKESMKDRGLGTPATRAAIIEKLIEVGYIKRNKKSLIPTEKGISLINAVPEKLKTPEMTAEWEYRLNKIYKGKEQYQTFMNDIKKFINEIVTEETGENKIVQISAKEIIGACPRCGKNVYEGPKNFYCEGYKDEPKCTFSIFKNNKAFIDRGKTVTASMAKKILKEGKIIIKGLKSKAGNEYNALFTMKDTGQYVNFEVTLANLNNKKK